MRELHDKSERDTLQVLRSNLTVYADGASGIPFADLLEFARPLFNLYELDPRHIEATGVKREAEELATLLSVLDLARLFWAYFLLPAGERTTARTAMESAVLGVSPSPEAISSLDELLDVLRERFTSFRESSAVPAATSGYTLPSFWELLEDVEVWHEEPDDDVMFASEHGAELPEALATFARPLFDAVNLEDPNAIDDVLARAQAYWELAHVSDSNFDQKLARIIERFGRDGRSQESILEEAREMVQRYRELFG